MANNIIGIKDGKINLEFTPKPGSRIKIEIDTKNVTNVKNMKMLIESPEILKVTFEDGNLKMDSNFDGNEDENTDERQMIKKR